MRVRRVGEEGILIKMTTKAIMKGDERINHPMPSDEMYHSRNNFYKSRKP
jgi:hypothetical protein